MFLTASGFWASVLWYLKQLLPLAYRTTYRDGNGWQWGEQWRMWFGRCFWIERWLIDTGKDMLPYAPEAINAVRSINGGDDDKR